MSRETFNAVALHMLIKDKHMSSIPMAQYSSEETVSAMAITRLEYNKARGWSVPKDENPSDDGFLVVRNIGTNQEHVSWLPTDTFNSTFAINVQLSHFGRMQVESRELDDKIALLDKFIKTSPIYGTLDPRQQLLMVKQLSAMVQYAAVLEERLILM